MKNPPSDEWYKSVHLGLATPQTVHQIIDEAIAARTIGLDSETRPRPGIAYSGLDLRPFNGELENTRSRLAGVCIATSEYRAFYLPLQHDCDNLDHALALRELGRLGQAIKNGQVSVCFWNSKFDQAVLEKVLGIRVWPEGSFLDGEILDRFIRPYAHNHRLKDTAAAALNLKQLEFEAPRCESWVPELADHPLFKPRPNMSQDFGARSPADCVQYAAGDPLVTLRYVLGARNFELREDTAALVALEHAFVAAIRALPRTQVGYDRAHVLQLADEYCALRTFCMELLADLGCMKPTSQKQIGELLARFGFIGDSTDKKALALIPREQAELRAVAGLVREFRLASTYISNYLSPIVNADHSTELCGAWSAAVRSGRMSAGPAKGKQKDDQHVFATWMPHGMPKERRFRAIIIARPGYLIVKIDFSSQEYRVCAVLARAQGWISVFNDPDPKKQDVHALTARGLFHNYDTVSDAERIKMRGVGKTFNFASIYGSSAKGIAALLNRTEHESQILLDRFYSAEPALRTFQLECQTQVKRDGKVFTYFGRPIAVRASDTVEIGDEGTQVHAAPNYRIQGTCSDLLKFAVVRFMHEHAPQIEIMGGDDSVRLINLIHDEVVLEVRADIAHTVAEELASTMSAAAPATWPLKLPVDINIGERWSA